MSERRLRYAIPEYYSPPDYELMQQVGRLLDEAKIPNVLWGYMASILLGMLYGANPHMTLGEEYSKPNQARERLENTSFVVPDEQFDLAVKVLEDDGFILCPNGPGCTDIASSCARPDAHFHTKPGYHVALYKKSVTLFNVDLTLDPPAEDDHHFILSNDFRLAERYPHRPKLSIDHPSPDSYPVKTLTAAGWLEAMLCLCARDFGHVNRFDLYWGSSIWELKVKLHKRNRFSVSEAAPQFRKWQNLWENYPFEGMAYSINNLQDELEENNQLPEPFPYNWFEDRGLPTPSHLYVEKYTYWLEKRDAEMADAEKADAERLIID